MDKSLQPLGLEEVKTKQTLVLFSLFYFCRVEDTQSKPRVWPAITSLTPPRAVIQMPCLKGCFIGVGWSPWRIKRWYPAN